MICVDCTLYFDVLRNNIIIPNGHWSIIVIGAFFHSWRGFNNCSYTWAITKIKMVYLKRLFLFNYYIIWFEIENTSWDQILIKGCPSDPRYDIIYKSSNLLWNFSAPQWDCSWVDFPTSECCTSFDWIIGNIRNSFKINFLC